MFSAATKAVNKTFKKYALAHSKTGRLLIALVTGLIKNVFRTVNVYMLLFHRIYELFRRVNPLHNAFVSPEMPYKPSLSWCCLKTLIGCIKIKLMLTD